MDRLQKKISNLKLWTQKWNSYRSSVVPGFLSAEEELKLWFWELWEISGNGDLGNAMNWDHRFYVLGWTVWGEKMVVFSSIPASFLPCFGFCPLGYFLETTCFSIVVFWSFFLCVFRTVSASASGNLVCCFLVLSLVAVKIVSITSSSHISSPRRPSFLLLRCRSRKIHRSSDENAPLLIHGIAAGSLIPQHPIADW